MQVEEGVAADTVEPSDIVAASSEAIEDNKQIKRLISKIQTGFNHRIERILAASGGLLVLLNQTDPTDKALLQELAAEDLSVVVLDSQTYAGLQRLGAVAANDTAQVLYQPEAPAVEQENPLIRCAQDKLRSAEILVEQQCFAGVMEILVATLLQIAAVASAQTQAPAIENATVWLYSEVLPAQLMTMEQVGIIVRVIALSQNTDVPDVLVQQALQDTQALVAQYQSI